MAAESQASRESFPRVDSDLAAYDRAIAKMQSAFAKIPADPKDKEWVKRKLAHMCEIDQFMRNQIALPFERKYSEDEAEYFEEQFGPRFQATDKGNTRGLKKIFKLYGWFKISEFGSEGDQNAWLLVQHADDDVDFQKSVLKILEALHSIGETSPSNYAYLFDRVATNEGRPQRYGTQGQCVGPGKWEPNPMEDQGRVDELRKSVGLEPLEEYKKRFTDICH